MLKVSYQSPVMDLRPEFERRQSSSRTDTLTHPTRLYKLKQAPPTVGRAIMGKGGSGHAWYINTLRHFVLATTLRKRYSFHLPVINKENETQTGV